MSDFRKGILYEIFAYLLWGLLPVYWHLLTFIGPFRILGARIVFSVIFTFVVLFILARGMGTAAGGIRGALALFIRKETRLAIIAAGLVIGFNWGIYIWAVNSGHTIDASLGYYINPLVSIILALVFLKERLSALQWAAFGIAACGVILMTVFSGVFPWAALCIAFSFGIYGLFKKKMKAGVLEMLFAETLAASPVGLLLLLGLLLPEAPLPAKDNIAVLSSLAPAQWLLLVSTGAISAVPLLAFARGAQLISLSTVGFIQFINPTILFLLGVFAFGESFSPRSLYAFAFIWIAVILYCISLRKK